jgi:dynein heavy chain
VWVEELGRELGNTLETGRFMNISMGQGQEKPAQAAIERFASSGGWIMLQVSCVEHTPTPAPLPTSPSHPTSPLAPPPFPCSRQSCPVLTLPPVCPPQNVHLMQSWLPTLERLLETVVESADADFRCFISAEASPIPTIATCPESLLQVCVWHN